MITGLLRKVQLKNSPREEVHRARWWRVGVTLPAPHLVQAPPCSGALGPRGLGERAESSDLLISRLGFLHLGTPPSVTSLKLRRGQQRVIQNNKAHLPPGNSKGFRSSVPRQERPDVNFLRDHSMKTSTCVRPREVTESQGVLAASSVTCGKQRPLPCRVAPRIK